MKIEEEIKQISFKSEYHKLAVNIFFSNGWLMSIQKEMFENYEITLTQYNILRILRGQHPSPISVNLLKERMFDKMSDTSRLVERLRRKGLVNRKICENDRRKSDIKITEEGLQILKSLDHLDLQLENTLGNLKLSEATILNGLLDKMRG